MQTCSLHFGFYQLSSSAQESKLNPELEDMQSWIPWVRSSGGTLLVLRTFEGSRFRVVQRFSVGGHVGLPMLL